MWSWEPDEPVAPRGADQPQPAEDARDGFGLRQIRPVSDAVTPPIRLAINLVQPQSTAARKPKTTSASSSRSENEGRMPRRVRRRKSSLTYLPQASEAVREDELLARLWGCQPASAHTRKQNLPELLRDVIAVRRTLGKTESLAAYLLPVEDALAHQGPASANPELSASLADCAEDSAEANYRADPTEVTARILLRKRAAERLTSLDHDRALAARYGITL